MKRTAIRSFIVWSVCVKSYMIGQSETRSHSLFLFFTIYLFLLIHLRISGSFFTSKVQTANDHWFFRRQHFIHCNESNLSQKWNVKSNVWPNDWLMDKADYKLRSKPWITIQKGFTLFPVIISDLLANCNFSTRYKHYAWLSFHHMSLHHNVGWSTEWFIKRPSDPLSSVASIANIRAWWKKGGRSLFVSHCKSFP